MYRKFVAGDYVTYVDFLFYDALTFHRRFAPELFNGRQIVDYLTRIENLPNLKDYLESTDHKDRPIFSPWSKWNDGYVFK